MRDHAFELTCERERKCAEAKRKEMRVARPRRKAKREVLRYRRRMRINGVVARNKRHAKELFQEKLHKRGREMEWEASEDSRPKKKRLVQTEAESSQGEIYAVTTLTGESVTKAANEGVESARITQTRSLIP